MRRNQTLFPYLASHTSTEQYEDPMSFVMDNVVATCNVLNFSRHSDSLETFVYFSTDEVFGPAIEVSNSKSGIDITQQIHIVLQRQEEKNSQ